MRIKSSHWIGRRHARNMICALALGVLSTVLTSAGTPIRIMAQESAPIPADRVIADMTIAITPPQPEGHCLRLEAGTLTVKLQAVPWFQGLDAVQPVAFTLIEYRVAVIIDVPTIPSTQVTLAAPIVGGVYCYPLRNLVPVSPDAPTAERGEYLQGIALKMTLAPQ